MIELPSDARENWFVRLIRRLDRFDVERIGPAFEKGMTALDKVFGGGSGPYE